MKEVAIVSAVRSPVCRADSGMLRYTRPEIILSQVFKESLARTPQIDWHEIGDVLVGCSTQEGEQGLNIARNASLLAGFPAIVPAATINRFDASSLTCLIHGVAAIRSGSYDIAVVGGVESMSRVPVGGFNPSPPPQILDVNPEALTPAGVAAENLIAKYHIEREEQDSYAANSHRKAIAAWNEGRFASETVPIHTVDGEGKNIVVSRDDITHEPDEKSFASLPPLFLSEGSVTAASSSPLADAAASIVLISLEKAQSLGIEPLVIVDSHSITGCQPDMKALGAVMAAKKVLNQSKRSIDDIDLIELSEQFAGATIACIRELKVKHPERININGGTISLGYPVGALGVRMVTTLVHAMESSKLALGMVTIGVLGGQGEAIIFRKP